MESGNRRNVHMHADRLLAWGKGCAEQPQPWSPLARDYERSNLHLYFLGVRGPELLAHRKTDGEPISMIVSKICSRSIICVEQKVSQRGMVSVEVVTLELVSNVLKRVLVTLVPLQTQVSCCAISANEERVLLGCIDGSVAVLDRNRGSTRTVKAAFIPKFAAFNTEGAVLVVSNEKGQVQYFDTALNVVQAQMLGEEEVANGVLDLSVYFNSPLMIESLYWGPTDLLVVSEQGPLIVVCNPEFSLGFTSLAQRYILEEKLEKAVALLLSWEFNQQSYFILQKICVHLMKLPLTEENAKFLQDALGSFHSPAVPMSTAIRHKFGAKVQYLTRRFFHQLVRASMFETAFLLAVDLGHHDLFMDLHYVAIKIGETEMAAAARAQASALLSRCSSEASDCSRSSCSQCSETESSSCSSEELSSAENCNIRNYDYAPNENYLTTNFNNVTPKTYVPITNTMTPKFLPNPKINYVKPPTVPQFSNVLAPPLPFAPATTTLGIPYENTSFTPIRTLSMPSIPQINTPTFPPLKVTSTKPLANRFSTTYSDDLFMFSAHSASNSNINTIKYTPIRQVIPPPLPVSVPASSVPSSVLTTTAPKKQQAKVKFSDTVTAFIVPEVKRPVRPAPPAHITDPQKELADSLPLCSPNEDYLKDFAPVRKNEQSENVQTQSKIKVVHFGVV